MAGAWLGMAMALMTGTVGPGGTSAWSRDLGGEIVVGMAWASSGVLNTLPGGGRPESGLREAVGGSPELPGPGGSRGLGPSAGRRGHG